MTNLFLSCLERDVIAQAQSGTGKTATFAVAILQQIDTKVNETQALVLAPTRELAQQVNWGPEAAINAAAPLIASGNGVQLRANG